MAILMICILQENAGNDTAFSYQEKYSPKIKPQRVDYGTGYWSEDGKINKNITANTTIFFLYDDLRPNRKMRLAFTKSTNGTNFLPLKIAKTIPFSSHKLSKILNYFSIKSSSKEAQIMKQTIEECEAPKFSGEDKYCATSLESLVDFIVAKLGKEVKTFCNEEEEKNKIQEYTVLKGVKMIGDNPIVCHKLEYKYAVFYCHSFSSTKGYSVPLVGFDGSEAEAIVICHTNTSAWNPNHFAFQVLNVKPGGPPICHILNSDTIVWIPR
ncbi:hypothetical protein JCGZ_00854 [Jatropha curcas]|uniref:BURP domain-containing protein n=1 Tax=Jatropha curcas TaxID=180498 RepID=A0A067KSH5_JATCU|nr:hypothetical protein JCGZ_00854 [Jatropha curcas]